MIGIKDIITAINDLLAQNFTDVTIQSTDITEGYTRPCFYVELDKNSASKINTKLRDKSISIRIYYFPKDRYNNEVENLNIQDQLENIFLEGLWVNPSFFMPTFQQDGQDSGLDFVIVDGVLQLQFYLYAVQAIEDTDTSEPLENLNVNTDVKTN
ncbi:DUF6838 family protein [Clostridium sp. Mt-5]|uniref:DUF6838 family protein n=1 Tax=Clostridium moutaii TaxID=3240932 RepID=A0ABV4BS53_9CLOT